MIGLTRYEKIILFVVIAVMLAYFVVATPDLMDDGNQYEGFTESLARGSLDFKSFYGFQGLSILSVPIYWLTGSSVSIIITSAILYLAGLALAYFIGRDFYPSSHKASKDFAPGELRGNKTAGIYFMTLILLMPYTYTTMMRGFQEAALLFFILLIIYGAVNQKKWVPISWAVGGIVKPFALVLFPLFIKDFLPGFWKTPNLMRSDLIRLGWVFIALAIGAVYLGVSYYQTGHLINNAAINSYQGNFDTGNPPPLVESFTVGVKGFLRIGANLFLHFRKILISPLVVVLGASALLLRRDTRLRKEIIFAVLLNFILVGSLTFSFSKYLLPMVILLALASVHYLLKYKWLMPLVLIDSFFVFLPIWQYFGIDFWSSIYVYLTPLWLATLIYLFVMRKEPAI